MGDKVMEKTGNSRGGMQKKAGYQPLNEGYSPSYQAVSHGSSNLPKAPTGGTGQSSSTQSVGLHVGPTQVGI